jgi:hypothetical protein
MDLPSPPPQFLKLIYIGQLDYERNSAFKEYKKNKRYIASIPHILSVAFGQ